MTTRRITDKTEIDDEALVYIVQQATNVMKNYNRQLSRFWDQPNSFWATSDNDTDTKRNW